MNEPIYVCKAEDGVFTMSFQAPRQLLLHDEFEQMVWNECLRQAHTRGHMPVGPVLVETAELDVKPVQSELREGESLKERMERWMSDRGAQYVAQGFGQVVGADLIQVTAQVQLGLSLED